MVVHGDTAGRTLFDATVFLLLLKQLHFMCSIFPLCSESERERGARVRERERVGRGKILCIVQTLITHTFA